MADDILAMTDAHNNAMLEEANECLRKYKNDNDYAAFDRLCEIAYNGPEEWLDKFKPLLIEAGSKNVNKWVKDNIAGYSKNALLSDERMKENISSDMKDTSELDDVNGHFGKAHDPNKTFNTIRDRLRDLRY